MSNCKLPFFSFFFFHQTLFCVCCMLGLSDMPLLGFVQITVSLTCHTERGVDRKKERGKRVSVRGKMCFLAK